MKDYTASRDLEDLVNYVNRVAGTSRQIDGSIGSSYGHLPEVDVVLSKIHTYTPEKMEEVRSVISKVSEGKAKFKKVYLSILKKIESTGESYVKSEKDRMEKFINSDSISNAKKGIFRLRSNILDAFIVKDSSEDEL